MATIGTMLINDTIEVAAPIEHVWALTIDVERWPQITPATMRSVTLTSPGPLVVGSTARVKQPGQGAKLWTVTVLAEPHLFAWQTRMLGVTMTATHSLTDTGTQRTTNKLTIELTGRGSSLLGRVARRPITRTIAKENKAFKTTAEAAVHTPD
jgi:uncharacterized membrane protein